MGFYEVLDQVVALLRQRGRATYGALKREFQLDDACLEDLKNELIKAQHVAVDEEDAVLVWTGAVPGIRQQAEAERQFQTVLLAVTALLQHDQRVTYRTLRSVLGVLVEGLRARVTEGFDTADLQEAKVLLEELA